MFPEWGPDSPAAFKYKSVVCQLWPSVPAQLRASMEGMAERWWFAPEHNDPLRQVFKKTEPKKSLQVGISLPLLSGSALQPARRERT